MPCCGNSRPSSHSLQRVHILAFWSLPCPSLFLILYHLLSGPGRGRRSRGSLLPSCTWCSPVTLITRVWELLILLVICFQAVSWGYLLTQSSSCLYDLWAQPPCRDAHKMCVLLGWGYHFPHGAVGLGRVRAWPCGWMLPEGSRVGALFLYPLSSSSHLPASQGKLLSGFWECTGLEAGWGTVHHLFRELFASVAELPTVLAHPFPQAALRETEV